VTVTFKKGYAVRFGLAEGVVLDVVDDSGKLWKLVGKDGKVYYADPAILRSVLIGYCAHRKKGVCDGKVE
jgi:hypothetical protein